MAPITSTINLTLAGTYVLEDDGISDNYTSRLRRPDGTSMLVVHPTSLLKITATIPGVTLKINMAESLEGARLIVGALNDYTLSPEHILVNQLFGVGSMSLAATGYIREDGDDPDPDIYGSSLVLSAVQGIGEYGNRLETQISALEAETHVGGMWINNIGNLVIGGLSDYVSGLQVFSSDDINLFNIGSIRLADMTDAQVLHGGSSYGSIDITASGTGATITSSVGQMAAVAPAGSVFLKAGGDIRLGESSPTASNDVLASGYVSIDSTYGTVFLGGDTDVASDYFGGDSSAGSVYIHGLGIELHGSASVEAAGPDNGSVTLESRPGGAVWLDSAGQDAVEASSGSVSIRADRLDISASSGITSSYAYISPISDGRMVYLAPNSKPGTALALSAVELSRIFASNLEVGNYQSGQVRVAGVVDLQHADNLTLRSGADIVLNADLTVSDSIKLETSATVVQAPWSNVATRNLSLYVDLFDNNGIGETVRFDGTSNVVDPMRLYGGEDGDNLSGRNVIDYLFGGGGNDVLRGLESNDRLWGDAGDDWLEGGQGGDEMTGGTGNDFYFVDAYDTVNEDPGGGTGDRVFAAASYTLGAGTDIEILSTTDNLATTPINLTGNALAQYIFGNAGANTLDGGGGGDVMSGFGGSDFYFIRNAADRINEGAGEGSGDRLFAAVSFALNAGAQVEILSTLDNLATTPINLTGNAVGQYLYGNAGANTLDGGGGGDVMSGFGGDDRYMVRSATDRAVEAAGNGSDRVFAAVNFTLEAGSHVEMLTTIDNLATTPINLTGNELANTIFGNAGANTLDGKGGADTLVGLEGADTFAFTTALGAGNVDNVSGFAAGLDKIALENAVFTGLAAGALPVGAFRLGTAAQDADDRILYESATGRLFFDADGVGGSAAVHFATLSPGLSLGAGDFAVI